MIKPEVKSDKVIVSISDNGSGIPPDLQKKLFTPEFYYQVVGNGTWVIYSKEIY